MSIPLKIGLGVIGLCVTSIGGTSLYHHYFPSTIEGELLKEGKKLIPNSDAQSWSTLSSNHYSLEAAEASKPENPKVISDLKLKDKSDAKEEELKKKCKELLKTSTKIENKEELNRKRKEASDWCVLDGAGFKVNI